MVASVKVHAMPVHRDTRRSFSLPNGKPTPERRWSRWLRSRQSVDWTTAMSTVHTTLSTHTTGHSPDLDAAPQAAPQSKLPPLILSLRQLLQRRHAFPFPVKLWRPKRHDGFATPPQQKIAESNGFTCIYAWFEVEYTGGCCDTCRCEDVMMQPVTWGIGRLGFTLTSSTEQEEPKRRDFWLKHMSWIRTSPSHVNSVEKTTCRTLGFSNELRCKKITHIGKAESCASALQRKKQQMIAFDFSLLGNTSRL
jgi:hypothetical protein